MSTKPKFYVVWKGRQPGVYASWALCEAQVKGFNGAEFKAFESMAEARQAFAGKYEDYKGKLTVEKAAVQLHPPHLPVPESYCVDAACSGVPGPVEYRCVHTTSRTLVFQQGPYPDGTNNIGEFLAIVHALALFKKKGILLPIYSDSTVALGWIKAKTCKTKHKPSAKNGELFDLIARAETWLKENTWSNRLLKWDTAAWGEIPADYGRK